MHGHKYRYRFRIRNCGISLLIFRLEKLGADVPKFDFRCPGVTSMSADLHKFGYTPKVSIQSIVIVFE